MDDNTAEKLQQLMQMALLGSQGPTTQNGYGLFPPSPFQAFPLPEDQLISPQDIFPLPGVPNA